MRWSCPHCGTGLGVSEERLGTGWSFSRCYKCGGYALVRRSEVNLVKVDRAPAGEPILLPESSETPLLSQEATDRLSKYVNKAPAKLSEPPTAMTPPRFTADHDLTFPEPLPEVFAPEGSPPPPKKGEALGWAAAVFRRPSRSFRPSILSAGIGMAGVLTIGSGIYLVVEGETLWEKTRSSGLNLVTDEVHQGAMAPARAPAAELPPSPKSAGTIPPVPAPPAAPAPVTATAPVTAAVQVATSASPPSKKAATQPTLVVQPKTENADIHSGPGSLYSKLGIANPKGRYLVADWNDRWFKIILAESRVGWIRTDLVHVVPATSEEKLPNDP